MKPRTHAWSFLIFLTLQLGHPRAVSSEETLTISQSLAELREKSPAFQALRYERDIAEAERRGINLFPNPEVGWNQERLSGNGEKSKEQTLEATFAVPVSGRRGLERKAADWDFESKKSLIDLEWFEMESDLKTSFFHLLFAQEQSKTLNEGLAKVRSLVTSIHGRGGAQSYDLLRINKELSEIESRFEGANLEKRQKESEFISLLGRASTETVRLSGFLNPTEVLPPLDEVKTSARKRPDWTALEARLKQHDLLRRSGSRGWIPDFNVSGGRKTAESNGVDSSGYVVGASFVLPLFNRGPSISNREEAYTQLTKVEQEKRRREIDLVLMSLYENTEKKRQLFMTYSHTTVRQAEELERAVGLSYLEGKRTLLELLDGYRESLGTHLRQVDLRFEARLAQLALERAAGIHFSNTTTGDQQ